MTLAAGGEAVGRLADGRIVFVPGGATEEEVEVSLDELRKGYVRGTLRRVLSPSPGPRHPAVCSLAAPGRCGGCPIMHVSRTAQLSAKQSWVTRAVRHSGAVVLPMLAPTPRTALPHPRQARGDDRQRGAKLSFAISRSSERQPIAACPVLDPKLASVLLCQSDPLTSCIGEGGSVSALVGQHQGAQCAARGRAGRRSPPPASASPSYSG
jgi:tRNA/tmRNA/rRNA uracil-C5-methylase (TrmA/RlmC/RlmD family)